MKPIHQRYTLILVTDELSPVRRMQVSRSGLRRVAGAAIAAALVIAVGIGAGATGTWWALALLPVVGYGFAWVGHFFFEKNRPATFRYPLYSLAGDFVMFRDILAGRIRI